MARQSNDDDSSGVSLDGLPTPTPADEMETGAAKLNVVCTWIARHLAGVDPDADMLRQPDGLWWCLAMLERSLRHLKDAGVPIPPP